jgi:aminoglycoside phosphotransferase (APT) family kinase protein
MRMHADEVETDVRLVGRLVAAQFPDWTTLEILSVPDGGTDNTLYRLGDDMVVRLPRHAPTTARLKKEAHWLTRLAPSLPLAIPLPLASGAPGEGYPFEWAIYRWLEGEAATPDRIADPVLAARDLAAFLRALQALDASGGPAPGAHNAGRGVPLVQRDAETRAAIVALGDRVDARAVTKAWDAALEAPDWERRPVWVHGDLDPRNLLAARGRLSAVIDFGCLGVGDPACDVAAAWKLFGGEAREVFRDELSVDDGTWERARGWVLSQALHALPYYTLKTNPVLVREAQRWLAEVMAH